MLVPLHKQFVFQADQYGPDDEMHQKICSANMLTILKGFGRACACPIGSGPGERGSCWLARKMRGGIRDCEQFALSILCPAGSTNHTRFLDFEKFTSPSPLFPLLFTRKPSTRISRTAAQEGSGHHMIDFVLVSMPLGVLMPCLAARAYSNTFRHGEA